MDNKLNLTSDEFSKIIGKEIGHGTDGIVFKYNKDYLIKLYRTNFMKEPSELINNAETKIYDKENKPMFKPIKSNLNFIKSENFDNNKEVIKLTEESAIDEIAKKQKKVIKTELPKKLVYVDGRLVGVLIKKVKGIQVHKFTGAPFAYKKKIALAIIDAVKELLDNNIYHVDLSNSPLTETRYMQGTELNKSHGHSHVLLNPFTMKINIIDLDGKSAIYTDYVNKALEESSLADLTTLLVEFLYGLDPVEYDFDLTNGGNYTLAQELIERGIDYDKAYDFANNGAKSIEEIKEIVEKSR